MVARDTTAVPAAPAACPCAQAAANACVLS